MSCDVKGYAMKRGTDGKWTVESGRVNCLRGWGSDPVPHQDGNTHVAGYVEDSGLIYSWEDGTFTKKGQTVPDPRKDTNMSENVFTLPEQPAVGESVKVADLIFTRGLGTGFMARDAWRTETGIVRSWAELFLMGETLTLVTDPYVAVARDAVPGDVANRDAVVAAVAKALTDDPRAMVVNPEDHSGAVGRVYSRDDLRNFTDLPDYVTQVTDRDGDIWSRTKSGTHWVMADSDAFTRNDSSGTDFPGVRIHAPLTVKTVK